MTSDPATKRKLKEADIDPSGELTADRTGETESDGSDVRGNNQPRESVESPSRSQNRAGRDRDSEKPPKTGHEE
jgi:hypothetical protein